LVLVSAPTAELAVAAVGPRPRPLDERPVRGLPAGRLYLWLTLAALAIAGLSLLIPSTPSYDPWAWLVWGREIVHLNLQTTGGPSWKPLPMIFTTVFALFGGAAPDLWLVVARAGALAAVAMTFRIAWRLTRDLTSDRELPSGRLRQLAPLLAGVIAAGTLVNAPGFITDNALGYSEGLATALALIAVDRYLDGAPRQAFVAGFFAALDRPELWVFWVPYGLFVMWRDPGARKLVLVLFALIPVLWFGPELWGSGQLLRNVTRALHPRSNSAAFARCPVCTVFRQEAWPLVPDRIKVLGILGLIAAAVGLWRTRASLRSGAQASRAARARVWLIAICVFGYVWWLGIAVETQAGFSGNTRYLVFGTTPIVIAGAISAGWLVHSLARGLRRVGRRNASLRPLASPAVGLPVAAVAVVGLLVAIPPGIGKSIVDVPRLHGALVYQAHLRQDMAAAVHRIGRQRILACGAVMTEGFQVPMLAYMLDVHTLRVEEPPAVAGTGPPPNVIFQTRAERDSTLLPIIRPWHVNYAFVDHQRTFRVFMDCAAKVI
jgi:hypothetical protein